MSLRILYVYFVNLYICNTYTFGFVLIRTCVFPIPCHTHTYIYNTRLNKRLNPYAGAMHLGASLNSAASTASCVSSQAASFDPGFTLGSGGKGWGKVATILHPKMLQNTSHAITAPWVKTFLICGCLLFLLNPFTGTTWRKTTISLPRANLEALSIKPTHTAPCFFIWVYFILSPSVRFPWNVWQDSMMLVYYMKMMGFLTRVFPLPASGVLPFIQYYCLDVPGILSAGGDWHSQIEEWLKRC